MFSNYRDVNSGYSEEVMEAAEVVGVAVVGLVAVEGLPPESQGAPLPVLDNSFLTCGPVQSRNFSIECYSRRRR